MAAHLRRQRLQFPTLRRVIRASGLPRRAWTITLTGRGDQGSGSVLRGRRNVPDIGLAHQQADRDAWRGSSEGELNPAPASACGWSGGLRAAAGSGSACRCGQSAARAAGGASRSAPSALARRRRLRPALGKQSDPCPWRAQAGTDFARIGKHDARRKRTGSRPFCNGDVNEEIGSRARVTAKVGTRLRPRKRNVYSYWDLGPRPPLAGRLARRRHQWFISRPRPRRR